MTSRRVYSTDQGRICPQCDQTAHRGPCVSPASTPQGDGIVRLRRETKGRKGAGVTLIDGLPLSGAELKSLAKHIKQRCSSGGAIKSGIVEIQGDHRTAIKSLLEQKGYTVKLAGS
jgi:translation initiation factor 1